MIYINRIGNGYRETVDECRTEKEARRLAIEYAAGDRAGHYYVSARPCKAWAKNDFQALHTALAKVQP